VNKNKKRSVRNILLMGVFWRILFIEGVLLAYSLLHKWITEDASSMDLFWYSIRITLLVIIIITFMMVTLRTFLARNIILPLEAITSANKRLHENISGDDYIELPDDLSHEIEAIVTSRSKMLKTILDITEEREKYAIALNDELKQGKKIQNDFLPHDLPRVKNCEPASYFHSALELSGDFYDVFELPDDHIGFVVGDVSGKGVGSALFMALVRSLLRIFSGSFSADGDSCRLADSNKGWIPEDALRTVYLTNEYIATEHSEDGMFVTLVFGAIDLLTGKMHYVNAGHEPLMIIDQNGIKHSLGRTGPALGPIQGAAYDIGTVQLEKGDILFSYTDGVTEAQSENKDFYTRARLKNIFNKGFDGSSDTLLEAVIADLSAFTGNAPQSDDITMLAIKWQGGK